MKIKIEVTEEKEFDLITLIVDAGVRYFEDGEINGKPDNEENPKMPFAENGRWKPIIDIETGIILGWPAGITADIHYKACDDGIYTVKDVSGKVVLQLEGYVPIILSPNERNYGDYIIMVVNESGQILNWNPTFKEFNIVKN